MKIITRAEIEKRLATLRKSCMNGDSYMVGERVGVCTYKVTFLPPSFCKSARNRSERCEIDLILWFERILGMDIKFKRDDTWWTKALLKTKDETKWHESKMSNMSKYKIVATFLMSPKLTYAMLCNNCFTSNLIKTEIDTALQEILGLTIVYDLAEVQKNIQESFSQYCLENDIPRALELLAEEKKEKFTLNEYQDFIEKLKNKLYLNLYEDIKMYEDIENGERRIVQ